MNQKIQQAIEDTQNVIENEIHQAWANGYKDARKELNRLKIYKIGGRLLQTTATRGAVRDAIETGTKRFDNGELDLESLLERLTLRGWVASWACIDDLSFNDIE